MTTTTNSPGSRPGSPHGTDKLIVVVCTDERQAHQGFRALKDLDAEGSILLYARAVIAKDPSGKVTVDEESGRGPVGTALGVLTGGMIGSLAGPLGVALGAYAGSLGGVVYDLAKFGVEADFLDEVKQELRPGKYALLAEVWEDSVVPLDTCMSSLGGVVFRCGRRDFIEDQNTVDSAEIVRLKAERDRASGKARAEFEVELDGIRNKLQTQRDRLEKKIAAIRREGDSKINTLQREAAVTQGETKAGAEKRLAASRAHYRARVEKLRKALQLVKETLEICDGSRNPSI